VHNETLNNNRIGGVKLSKPTLRVAHLIPSMDIGGVEVAIYKSYHKLNDVIDYRVFWIRRSGSLKSNQKAVYRLIIDIILRKWKPDIIITSLWWAHCLGPLVRLLNIKWVAFFHSTNFTNFLDLIFSRYAWRKSNSCFVDSMATRNFFVSYLDRKSYIIPYVFEEPMPINSHGGRSNDIVWVGRVVREKRIDILFNLISIINEYLEENSYFSRKINICVVLAGEPLLNVPDFSSMNKINIEIASNLSNGEVFGILSNSRLYVMTSDTEGMSMTTIEAIQAGCVPVVRRVGEVANYLSDEACIEITDVSIAGLKITALQMVALLRDREFSDVIKVNAQRSIESLGYYVDTLKISLADVIDG